MDAFFGKIMDACLGKFVDFGVNKFKSITDFNENLETLERNVKLLSDRASDVETDVKNREQSGKKKRKREVDSWFDEVTEVKEGLRALKEEVARGKKNVGALVKMNGRVGELLEQSKHFGTLVHDIYEREECPLPVPQVHEEISKQNINDIWSCLLDNNVSSIGIYGMAGVGKTTLAKHIHNRLVNEVRYHVCWVTVSQGFSIKRLQDDLAKIVNLDLCDEVDEQIRAAKLYRAFKERKNIVIILDDVWNRLYLEKLGNPLGVEGCRLILTTRSREVCEKMGCKKLFEVKKLNTDDAWELFKKTLGDATLLSPDIEPVAKSLAKRCKGLPLGLITLAGSMRGVTDIREWRNALKEFPDDMESDVFKVLQYSYDRLRNTNMKECFLYCALYPEDDEIDRDALIDRFIMEGLVKGNSRQEEFDQGHTILNELVKACLLEATTFYEREQVKMHDLLREMALRITNVKPRYMVRAGIRLQLPEEQDWTFDLDKVSFIKSEIKGIPEDMAPYCPSLSTLLFCNCSLRRIPESFFQHMNKLQVLDLSGNSELMDLPSCISNLGSLRALLLGGCKKLRSVPPLGKLKNLRVLDLRCTGIKEVPQGMGNLVKLKYLDMGRIDLEELPKEILPKLSHLQSLKIPECINAQAEDLASLELLEEFEGRFCDLHNFNKFMTSRRNYERDWWYDIYVGDADEDAFFEPEFGDCKLRRVVVKDCTIEAGGGEAPTSIILPHCIQTLRFENCHGLVDNFLSQTTLRGLICEISECDDIEWIINVPSGRNTTTDPHCICFHSLTVSFLPNLVGLCKGNIASHTFSGLTELIVLSCCNMKKLFPRAILQDLENLQELVVQRCFEMEEIIAEEATDQDGSSQLGTSSDILILPKLKELNLFWMPKLKRICEGNIASHTFSGLKKLTIYECHNMKKLLPRAILQDLENLQELVVQWCFEMEEIIAEEATDQDGSSQLGTSSDVLILPKLKELDLSDLPKLERICEGKLICDSLERMIFSTCPKLKRLPFYTPTTNVLPFPALREIDCDEMEEIIGEEATDEDGSSQLGTSSDILILPKLKWLRLYDLPKLKSICEGKLICDSLEGMSFYNCPKLKKLPFYAPTTNALPFPALREMEVEEDCWETLEWEQSHLKTLFQPHIKYMRF